MKKKEQTSTIDWLNLDLQSQSGSIWTDEKSKLQKGNTHNIEYEIPDSEPVILKPDSVKYGNWEIKDNTKLIQDSFL